MSDPGIPFMLVNKLYSFREMQYDNAFLGEGVSGMAGVMEKGLDVQVTQVRPGVKGIR